MSEDRARVPFIQRLSRLPLVLSLYRRVRARILAPLTADLDRLSRALPDALNTVAKLERETESLRADLQRQDNELQRLDADRHAASNEATTLRNTNRTLETLLIASAQPPRPQSTGESPAVSVIMATRGRASVIANAIRSVQAQMFPDWELIIVDDGSADHRAPELGPFLADNRISIHAQPADGAPAARNRGLELARGSLIAYLDTDCTWFPGFLAAAVATFDENPAPGMVYGALVTDAHKLDGTRILFEPFDRAKLLQQNFIDLNVLVHRRALTSRYGNFDSDLTRLQDWDLILRYTADAPALQVPVLAATYGSILPDRIGRLVPTGENFFKIRRKWRAIPPAAKALRVLYVIWHYPQLSEQYIETEIRCMQRWGVQVEVWCETGPAAGYETSVPVHRGTLADAIAKARPHVLHVHWLHYGHTETETFRRAALPMTARAHGFEFNSGSLGRMLDWPWVRRIYLFPHQMPVGADARLRAMNSGFETPLFKPRSDKDRKLVVRTAAGLASKDLQFMFELAKRLPDFRFVVAAVTCKDAEGYIERLRRDWKETATPCELMIDVPREQVADLVSRAAFYLHTLQPPGQPGATPIGMPVSIAEAMATGAHVLVRDEPALTAYAGDAGSAYRDLDGAADILRRSTQLSDDEWREMFFRSVDRAFGYHADEDVHAPLLVDWCEMADLSDAQAASQPMREAG